MLALIPRMAPSGIAKVSLLFGQTLVQSTSQFLVPEGVFSLSAVCVGCGGNGKSGANNRMGGGGGGGGLIWVNNIPVTPGELLDVVVGLSSDVTASAAAASLVVSSLGRNGVPFMYATSGRNGVVGSLASGAGVGGQGGLCWVDPALSASARGNQGGTGGTGGLSTTGGNPSDGAGGGAAGFMGNGGNGGTGGTGNSNSAGNGSTGTGGAGGGGKSANAGVGFGRGGSVGLQALGLNGAGATVANNNGADGSLSGPVFGAGGTLNNPPVGGAVRIIWGQGRAFPSTDCRDYAVVPGSPTLIAGNDDVGYYGSVPDYNLINVAELCALIGINDGIVNPPATQTNWLKFSGNGKTLFVAQIPFRYIPSWDTLDAYDLVFGRVISFGGNTYKVRLLTGGNNNPSTAAGGEWNDLIYPVSSADPSGRHWASLSSANLGITGNGSASWCQETIPGDGTRRVTRGGGGLTVYANAPSNGTSSSYGWRPVLELVSSQIT